MSSIKLESNASGTGIFTIASPNSNTNRTLTLPDATGTINTSGAVNEVPAGSASAPAIYPTGDTNTGIFFPAADTIAFGEGGAESMRIDSSGRMLVGTTTSPSAGSVGQYSKVVSSGNTSGATGSGIVALTKGAAATSIVSGDDIGFLTFTDSAGNDFSYIRCQADANAGSNDYPGRLIFATTADGSASPTERARITSGGYFKASNSGTYLGATGTYHEFSNNANSQALIVSNSSTSLTADAILRVDSSRNTTDNTYYAFSYYHGGTGTYKFRIADSGNATNTNGSYGTISDLKLKQDITDATPQWDDIKNLRFRKYRLKSEVELDPNAKPFLGLVAQEAELVCPGLVEEHIDRDKEDNDLGTTTKSIKTSILYMKAVKALQEAMARIETLEAQNAAFEARLAALEAQ